MVLILRGFFLYLPVFKHTHADSGQLEAIGNTNSMDTEYSTAFLGEIDCLGSLETLWLLILYSLRLGSER